MTALEAVPITEANAVEVFVGGGIDAILSSIHEEVAAHSTDVFTAAQRKDVASLAHKISRAKAAIDRHGKALVGGWKKQAKAVDVVRKHARDTLDALRDEVRRPLNEWEAAEEARAQAAKLAAEVEAAHAEALVEDEIWGRRRAAEARAAEFERAAARRRAEEEAERVAKAHRAREERLVREAADRARREAAAKAVRERQALLLREVRAREAQAKAERDKLEAVEAAKRQAAEAAAAKEREAQAKVEAERQRAADAEHRREVHQAATDCIAAAVAIPKDVAALVVQSIAEGEIPGVSIRY